MNTAEPVQAPYAPTTTQPVTVAMPVHAPYAPTTTQPVTVAVPVHTMHFGEDAVSMFCPYCQQGIITEPNYTPGTLTWLAGGIVCCAGGVAGCCLIPFIMDSCKDVAHSCPKCDRQLGLFQRW